MGDEFRWNINAAGVLPANFEDTTAYPWGLRAEAGIGLQYEPVFLESAAEGSLHDMEGSPLGIDHYDMTSPPNFTLSGGLAIKDAFFLRLGRHHYERTEVEGLLTDRAYSVPATFATTTPSLGILGGEALYQIDHDEGALRELKTRIAYFASQDSSHFGVMEGLITFGLGESGDSPTLSLAAYGTIQSTAEAGFLQAPTGFVHGQGLGASLAAGIFTGSFGFTHRYGAFPPAAAEERSAVSSAIMLAPENFLFHGAFSWLNHAATLDSANEPPVASSENHFEISAGYHPNESFLLSAGYRGIRSELYSSNQIFLGIQASFGGSVPFGKTEH